MGKRRKKLAMKKTKKRTQTDEDPEAYIIKGNTSNFDLNVVSRPIFHSGSNGSVCTLAVSSEPVDISDMTARHLGRVVDAKARPGYNPSDFSLLEIKQPYGEKKYYQGVEPTVSMLTASKDGDGLCRILIYSVRREKINTGSCDCTADPFGGKEIEMCRGAYEVETSSQKKNIQKIV